MIINLHEAQTLLQDRGITHGDWLHQSKCACRLKEVMVDTKNYCGNLSASQREALDMIAVKISRILEGNPNFADHWDDIIGYATLARNAL